MKPEPIDTNEIHTEIVEEVPLESDEMASQEENSFSKIVKVPKSPDIFFLVPYRCFNGGDCRFTLHLCVHLSDCPSAKSGSCDNLKTVQSLLMKLGKGIDEKVEIMHVLLFVHPL